MTSAEYNRFSGLSLERVQTLSDGVFAVAMTLLVLDVRVPVEQAVHSDHELWSAITDLGPNFAAYLLSFTMLGTFWLAQHTLLGLCERASRTLTWLQLIYLLVVALLPFSASVLAEHAAIRLSVGVYWFNILLLGVVLAASGRHIAATGLLTADSAPRLQVFRRRIVVAQVLYGVAALLCLIDPYVGIVALGVVQVYFIVSPRLPVLDRVLMQGSHGDRDE